MAIRYEPVALAFNIRGSTPLAAGAKHTFSAKTMHVPMTEDRVFSHMVLTIHVAGKLDTIGFTARTLGLKIGAAAEVTETVTCTLASTAESETWVFTKDVTGQFNSDFGAGVSAAIEASFEFAGAGADIYGISATVEGVVEYDDSHSSAETRVRHVAYELGSINTGVLNTQTDIATFDVVLPEDAVTVRQVWFEITGNNGSSSSGNHKLNVAIDGEAEVDLGEMGSQNSGLTPTWVWCRDDFDPLSGPNVFKARCNTTNKYFGLRVSMHIVYTYSHDTSGTCLSWVRYPVFFPDVISFDSSNPTVVNRTVHIQDPGSIIMENAGLVVYSAGQFSPGMNLTFQVEDGGGVTYPMSNPSNPMGPWVACHPLADARGTWDRGENTLDISVYQDPSATPAQLRRCEPIYGFVSLVYSHDMPPEGDGVATKTFPCHMLTANQVTIAESNGVTLQAEVSGAVVPAQDLCILGAIGEMWVMNRDNSASFYSEVEPTALELADGIQDLRVISNQIRFQLNLENVSPHLFWPVNPNKVKLTPTYPRPGLDLAAPHDWKAMSASPNGCLTFAVWLLLTGHGYTYDFGDALTGFSGDGSGIPVEVYRDDTDEIVARVTSTIGGDFTATVYDNTVQYYAAAQQDTNRFGRTRTSPA